MFINDLPEDIVSRTRLFADDCIVYRQINKKDDCATLQSDLRRLESWEKKWGMTFHPQKCSVMSITRSRSPIMHNYKLKGLTLSREHSTKYLGVDIQSNLQWNDHIARITKKSNSILGFLRRNLKRTSEETKASAYKAMVRSNLEYCATVWSPHHKVQINKVEMVQRRAARFTTNRYRNTSSVRNHLKVGERKYS